MRVDSITLTEKLLGSHTFGYKHEGYTNIAGFMEKMLMTTENHHGIFRNFGAPYFQTKPYFSSVKIVKILVTLDTQMVLSHSHIT